MQVSTQVCFASYLQVMTIYSSARLHSHLRIKTTSMLEPIPRTKIHFHCLVVPEIRTPPPLPHN